MLPPELAAVAAAQPYPLLFATVSGAHLYGFPSPDSDYDLRGVHLLPVREVVGLDPGRETIEVSQVRGGLEIDLVTHDASKFFLLLLKKNGYVLEQLHSPLVVHTTPEHAELKAIARDCVTRHHSHQRAIGVSWAVTRRRGEGMKGTRKAGHPRVQLPLQPSTQSFFHPLTLPGYAAGTSCSGCAGAVSYPAAFQASKPPSNA